MMIMIDIGGISVFSHSPVDFHAHSHPGPHIYQRMTNASISLWDNCVRKIACCPLLTVRKGAWMIILSIYAPLQWRKWRRKLCKLMSSLLHIGHSKTVSIAHTGSLGTSLVLFDGTFSSGFSLRSEKYWLHADKIDEEINNIDFDISFGQCKIQRNHGCSRLREITDKPNEAYKWRSHDKCGQ